MMAKLLLDLPSRTTYLFAFALKTLFFFGLVLQKLIKRWQKSGVPVALDKPKTRLGNSIQGVSCPLGDYSSLFLCGKRATNLKLFVVLPYARNFKDNF